MKKLKLKQIIVCVLAFAGTLSIWATDVYVNADTGSDTGNGGTSPADAYQSLQKAVTGLASGSTVHVAAGTYKANSATAPDNYPSRVVVPAGVTLVADGEGEAIIEGETGMRCVWLEAGAKLKGFTVRGGSIPSGNYFGAGVASASANATVRHKADVEDCIITCNTNAYRGGGISCVVARRCQIVRNVGTGHGGAAYYGLLYNCIVDGNESDNSTCMNTPTAVNCTFGPDNTSRGFHKAKTSCSNCIFLGEMIDDGDGNTFTFDHCAFASDGTGMEVKEEHIGEGSFRVPAAQIQLADDYTPISDACVALDAGDNAVVDGTTDVYGHARIYNETVDMGAVEAGAGLMITVADGGIAVTGAVIGRTALSDKPITVTLTRTFDSAYGCCGFLFNGELIRFGEGDVGESWTHAFSAADGSASLVAVYEKVWYVDAATNLADGQTHDGRSKARAFKTLAAAMANPSLVAGDEVRALPGAYASDTMTCGDGEEARVVVKAGVTLAAGGSAEETIIRGGTNVRGVWLEEGATLRGFTVTGGDLDIAKTSVFGGGVAMQNTTAARNKAFAEDCRIVSNAAYRGGGIANVVVRRSFILDNVGKNHAAASYYGALYDCVVDGHKETSACTFNTTPMVNCTFGPGNTVRGINAVSGIAVTNCLFACQIIDHANFANTFNHCLFVTNYPGWKENDSIISDERIGSGSRKASLRDVALRADYTLRRSSVAIDAGLSLVAGTVDINGVPRVLGEAVDVGAAEYDPSITPPGILVIIR